MQRLAGVLAYLEVSEAGPNAHLEKEAQTKFEHWMTWVDSEVQEFKQTQHKVKGGGKYEFTLQEAIRRRPTSLDTGWMVANFKFVRNVCNNVITPAMKKKMAGGGVQTAVPLPWPIS